MVLLNVQYIMLNTFNRNFFRYPDLTNFLLNRVLKNATFPFFNNRWNKLDPDIRSSCRDASPNFIRRTTIERRYYLMWITHYDVYEFLHVLQLRHVVLELHSVVLKLRYVVLQLHSVVLILRYVVLQLH